MGQCSAKGRARPSSIIFRTLFWGTQTTQSPRKISLETTFRRIDPIIAQKWGQRPKLDSLMRGSPRRRPLRGSTRFRTQDPGKRKGLGALTTETLKPSSRATLQPRQRFKNTRPTKFELLTVIKCMREIRPVGSPIATLSSPKGVMMRVIVWPHLTKSPLWPSTETFLSWSKSLII